MGLAMVHRTGLLLFTFFLLSIHLRAQSVTELIAQLSHTNSDVQGKAVEKLGELGDRRAVEPILQLLDSPDQFLRWRCITALEKLKDVRAIPPLIQLLDKATDYSNNFSISQALGAMGSPGVDLLVSALRSPSGSIREGVASALGRIADDRATMPLIELLSDPSSAARSNAAT